MKEKNIRYQKDCDKCFGTGNASFFADSFYPCECAEIIEEGDE